jgi:hypothetical protein
MGTGLGGNWRTWLAVLGIVLACALWWQFFELRDVPVRRASSTRQENPWLAAKLLAERHHIQVHMQNTLDLSLSAALPAGTLYLPDSDGKLNKQQAQQLLAWVGQGNALLLRPRHSKREVQIFSDESVSCTYRPSKNTGSGSKSESAVDPISAKLGVSLWRVASPAPAAREPGQAEPSPRCQSSLSGPGQAYPFTIDTRHNVMQAAADAKAPLYSDRHGWAVRVYQEGKGHIVLLADSYFDNAHLPEFDNAALWLSLLHLPQAKPELTIVRNLATLPWYQRLWHAVPLLLFGLALGALLWLWNGLPRFGAILPAPETERRALIEHIDASSRWLWHKNGGAQLLLDAMRRQTFATLLRRAPALMRLPVSELIELLLQSTRISRERLEAAFNGPAATRPQSFIVQIQTLQQVRKHYER